jgi:hypothetical protein
LTTRITIHYLSGVSLDHKLILGILLLCGFGEVEGAGYDRPPIDHHDLVVRDGMARVYLYGDT